MLKKIFRICASVLLAIALFSVVVYALRRPLMRAAGSYLIEEDSPSRCEALFILSGGALDRSAEAYRLFRAGLVPYVVCTGENVPSAFRILDLEVTESELTRKSLNKLGMPDSLIQEVQTGTSTREEADLVLNYCRIHKLKKVLVVSDKFHTHRVNQVFRNRLADAGIEMVLRGAPSTGYREDKWWAGEAGLLMVNNEYIKLVYYFLSGLNK